jgi:hypothetical protein
MQGLLDMSHHERSLLLDEIEYEPKGDERRSLQQAGAAPYQVDPGITRPQLLSHHTKWFFCSLAYWGTLGKEADMEQKFVPSGYWFESGRLMPAGTNCGALTGNDIPTTTNGRVTNNQTMVLPVINSPYFACNKLTDGALEDPRVGPFKMAFGCENNPFIVHTATLDGQDIDYLDSIVTHGQDGDFVTRLNYGNTACRGDFLAITNIDYKVARGCPLSAGGPYVFINTRALTKGKHVLILVGEAIVPNLLGLPAACSAVRHEFTIV